jgi:hypothetical protein
MLTNILLSLILATLVVIAKELWPIAKAQRLLLKKGREFAVGFGPASIEPGVTATFIAELTCDYDGERLIVPSSLANHFSVNDITVDEKSQVVSSNPIPAAAFSELAVGVNLGLKTAKKDSKIALKVANTSSTAQVFAAAMIGRSRDDAAGSRAKRQPEPVSGEAAAI